MKTRFAPSPTGPFHVGGLRTALLAHVLAQKEAGECVLRIEDTDTQRSTKEYEDNIVDSLSWAGLTFPPNPVRQSSKMARYKSIIDQLLATNQAYYCYMSSRELDDFRQQVRSHNKNASTDEQKIAEKYDNRYRPENWPQGIPQSVKDANPNPVVRLKMPTTGFTAWVDRAKGEISIPNSQLDDLIIARSDGSPTYNFCVVVDDMDMNITDVIRGEDHISNTPKQKQIAHILKSLDEFKDAPFIEYCHIPLMFNPDGSKVSKSALADPKNAQKVKDGLIVPASIEDYREMGILPLALINYLLLISSQKTAEIIGYETFSINDFIDNFNFSHLSHTSSKFDLNKLKEINWQYIKALNESASVAVLMAYNKNYDKDFAFDLSAVKLDFILLEAKKRSKTVKEFYSVIKELMLAKSLLKEKVASNSSLYVNLDNALDHDSFKAIVTQYASVNNQKFGDVAKMIRGDLNVFSGLPLYEFLASISSVEKVAHEAPPSNKAKP